MHTARVAALQLRRDYRIAGCPTYEQLCAVAADLGVQVDEDAPGLRGRVKEVVSVGAIGLAPGLPMEWKRWFLAHGIGHLVCHHPVNHLCMGRRDARQWRHERDAEIFSGYTFWAHMLPPDDDYPEVTPHLLAEAAGLPVSCAAAFLSHAIDMLPITLPAPIRSRAS